MNRIFQIWILLVLLPMSLLAQAPQGPAEIARLEKALAASREAGDRPGEARTLKELAVLLHNAGDAVKAAELIAAALPIAREVADRDLEARLWNNLGLAFMDMQEGGRSRSAFEKSLEIAGKDGLEMVEALALCNLADLERAGDNPKAAVPLLERAAILVRKLGNPGFATRVLGTLAGVHADLGELQEAARLYEETLQYARAANARLAEAGALTGLGMALSQMEQPEKAIEPLQKALEIAREIASPETEAAALQGFARAAEAFDQRLVLATESHDRTAQAVALQALVKINDQIVTSPRLSEFLGHMAQAAGELDMKPLEGVLLVQLGLDRITWHDPEGAISPLERGLALVTEPDLHPVLLEALDALALAHQVLRNPDAAVRYAERLLSEAGKANDPIMKSSALRQLSWAAQERGDLVQAIDLAEQGLATMASVPGADDRREHLFSYLGFARYGVGDYEGALKAFGQMRQAARNTANRKGEALALQFQAGVKLIQGERQASAGLLQESMAIGAGLEDPEIEWQALANLGLLAAWDNDHAKAAEHWQKLLEVVRRPTSPLFSDLQRKLEAITLGYLSRAQANLGRQGQAVELADSAVSLAEREGESFDQALALDSRAYVHLTAGRLPAAEADARAAIERFETIRGKLSRDELAKVGALDQQSSLYDAYQQILVRQGRHADALAAAELGRARAFAEALGQGESQPAAPEDLERIARSLGATVVEFSILHDATRYLIPGRLQGLRASLEDELYIWVLPPDGPLSFRSVDLKATHSSRGETLSQQVDYLLKLLKQKNGSAADLRASLRDLHDELIAPISALLPRDPEASVVIVPHGVLFQVPFPALLDRDGRYLVERHTLLTAPSIESLIRLRRSRPMGEGAGSRALIVGNPRTSRAFLPLAEKQAKTLAAQLGTGALVGEQATEAAMRQALPHADLVVFAGHGVLDERGHGKVPGALALTPSAPGEDGLLTSDEIRALDLKADLVVLSACESGMGRISGDGVMGLPRSFLAAGAAGVVMSLWQIDDEATSNLMIDFHRRLITADPARALRGAMLGAIGHGVSPRHWGAFSYIGAPRELPVPLSAP